jgi:CDP-glycerol glycerophosphotransferase (TagB/SpsB family)
MLHAHIGHGESDKTIYASHLLNAYDRVLIAGPAAADRIAAALLETRQSSLLRIGRPQLDLPLRRGLPASSFPTVLYAPTWEGRSGRNDYTSETTMGARIVAAALSLPDVRVVYRPHPRVVSSAAPEVRRTHRRIATMVEQAAAREPGAGHHVSLTGSIFDTFLQTDLMVTDVSSVAADFLYLRVDRPIIMTDHRGDIEAMHASSPMSRSADVLTPAGLDELADLLRRRLEFDELREAREAMRNYYFGDLTPGESTETFLRTVRELVALRDQLKSG